MTEIDSWLEQLGLAEYAQVFAENDIDWEVLGDLTEHDLTALGVSMGHRKKIIKAIKAAVTEPTVTQSVTQSMIPGTAAELGNSAQAERRHLTILFADLVGSTELSVQLDPEDLRELIVSYQNAVVGEISRYEGYVARFMGDGVLAYFGWPRAHEDNAERAVRAGLALVSAVAGMPTPSGAPMAARVGIATGVVVVGDLIGEGASQEEAAVGDTPNLAARLQGLAQRGCVVISDSTRQLLGEQFELVELEPQSLKGLPDPVPAFTVLHERSVESCFEAHHTKGLSPLIGRQQELALLMDRWNQVVAGEGQLVLLTGEAGIGKSRIAQAFMEALTGDTHVRVRYQCSPFHTESMLYPTIQQLGRAAAFDVQDTAETRLDKLERALTPSETGDTESIVLLADLLGIETESRYKSLELTPQQKRDRTLETLVAQLIGLARQRPVLWIIEDVHWMDPTTGELVERVLDQISRTQVLVLMTARPIFQSSVRGHPHVTQLTLNRLGRSYSEQIVRRLSRGKILPDEILEEIAAKTDGVPLFVEELTKTVLESGLLRETEDAFVLDVPLPPLAIPASLHDSLLARLDRLAPIKEIAQTAACIGREFSYELLSEVGGLAESELRKGLESLVAAELVFRRGAPPTARYIFKHALVQDATYNSLLRSKRQQLHARIAQALERGHPDTVENEPELLAHHCRGAGLYEQAITYWQKAGQRGVQRSANTEAVAHLRKGLELIDRLEDVSVGAQRELALQAQLGPALIAARGYGARETAQCFERARELTERVGDSPELFPVLYGCWVNKLTWAEYPTVRTMADQFLQAARQHGDRGAILTGHRILGFSLSCLGDFAEARENFEHVLSLYSPQEHASLAFRYGQDPKAAGASMLGWNLWHLGYPTQAVRVCDQAVDYAIELNHMNTRGYVETFGAVRIQLFRRDRAGVQRYVDSMTALCEEQKLVFWVGYIRAFEGWLLAEQGRHHEAIDTIKEGLASFDRTGTALFKPHSHALLAQAYAGCQRIDESLRSLDDAMVTANSTSEHWITAELYRLKGEILLQTGGGSNVTAVAESWFRKSLAFSRERSAKSWELRAATSLARLWRNSDKSAQARALLEPVYEWFTEGHDNADLEDAQVLLEEMS